MAWLSKRTSNDRHFVMKLVLRIICLAFTLASLIAAAASIRGSEAAWFVTWYTAAWAMSIVWNLVWIVIMLGRQRPIVPGLIVAFDLIIWLYYLVPAVFGWFAYVEILGSFSLYYDRYYTDSERQEMAAGAAASGVLAFLAICLHFWLFILGCIDEDRRRRAIKAQLMTLAANAAAPVHHNHGSAGHFTHCVDCHGIINLRCPDCAASAATRENKAVGLPNYFAPTSIPQHANPTSKSSRASYDLNEKSGQQVVSEQLR